MIGGYSASSSSSSSGEGYPGPYDPNPVPQPSPAPGLPPLVGGGPKTAMPLSKPKRAKKTVTKRKR